MKRKNSVALFEHATELERDPKKAKWEYENSRQPAAKALKKESCRPVKLSEEPLNLRCEWNSCGAYFNSWEMFNSHLIKHTYTNPEHLTCQWTTCDFGATSIALLMWHVSYHGYISKLTNIGQNIVERCGLSECNNNKLPNVPNKFDYICEWEYCSRSSSTLYEYFTHFKQHVNNTPTVSSESEEIRCCWSSCNVKCPTQTRLTEHLRTHSKEKTVGCPTCFAIFSNKTKFIDHRTRQQSSFAQSFKCFECLKLFPSDRLLRKHSRGHVHKYKCTMCDMACAKPSHLAIHLRSKHILVHPYECTHCGKTFVTKNILDGHLRVHEKDAPMKCNLCHFSCRTRVGLNSHHVREHDAPALSYECHFCKGKFKRGDYLKRHLMKMHGYGLPIGYSRIRYRKEEDGVYRLQTNLERIEILGDWSIKTREADEGVCYLINFELNESGGVVSVTEADKSHTPTEEVTMLMKVGRK